MGRFFCRWRFVYLLGLLGGLTAHAESPVWAIRGAHNTVFLAGSVHLLKADNAKLPPGFDKAYAASDALVMEIDLDDLNPLESQAWMLEHGMFGDEGSTLSKTIGVKKFAQVELEGNRLGLPVEALEQLKPWLVAMTLAQLQYMKLGFDPEQGVEKQIQGKAAVDHKEITGLETLEEQLGLLDGMSFPDQTRFLDLTLEEMHEMEGETDTLLAAWRTGNAPKLASLLSEEYNVAPALYRMLVADRNRRWMPKLEALLKGDKNYLVVVGALHLVGNGGLLQLMKADGFDARQLQ
ncbi:MAG TPA: TraB/GumN family protein [Steroidobacteraceae bacterium]|nr:TraB/GumN family protein [Steroidobacteraceae bacterium]